MVGELVHHVQRLPGAGLAHAQHVLVVLHKRVDDVRVPHGVRGGHDDLRERRLRVHRVRIHGFHPLDPPACGLVVAELEDGAVRAAGGHRGGHVFCETVRLRLVAEETLQSRSAGAGDGRA